MSSHLPHYLYIEHLAPSAKIFRLPADSERRSLLIHIVECSLFASRPPRIYSCVTAAKCQKRGGKKGARTASPEDICIPRGARISRLRRVPATTCQLKASRARTAGQRGSGGRELFCRDFRWLFIKRERFVSSCARLARKRLPRLRTLHSSVLFKGSYVEFLRELLLLQCRLLCRSVVQDISAV